MISLIYDKNKLRLVSGNKDIPFNINSDINIEEVRAEFNSALGELSVRWNSLEYWLLRISERNTMGHDLFLDICYAVLISRMAEDHEGLKVHTNKCSMYILLRKWKGVEIRLSDKMRFVLKRCLEGMIQYLAVAKWLMKNLYVYFLARVVLPAKTKPELSDSCIIQTWTSDQNFGSKFKDSYYGDLRDYLSQGGRKVITWPVFYNVRDKYGAIQFIRQNIHEFLLTEDYLGIVDYFTAVKHFVVKKRKKWFRNIRVYKIDSTDLFRYYLIKERVEDVSLFYLFAKRIGERGCKNVEFIINHENMVGEKSLIIGARKHVENCRIVGYFHSTKPRNILCLDYASEDEFKIAPKPHKIVFNSACYLNYFKARYPELRCVNGYAFKQGYLASIKSMNESRLKKLLVLLPGGMKDASFLLGLINDCNEIKRWTVIFKMHPMNIFDIERYLKVKNCDVAEESLDVLLRKVSKVVCTYSATLIEAVLYGKELGFVYNPKELLLNPFDDTGIDGYVLISNQAELEEFIKRDLGNAHTKNIFNVDKAYYRAFLGN